MEEIKQMIFDYFRKQFGDNSEIYQLISERMNKFQIEVLESDEYNKRTSNYKFRPAGLYDSKNKKVILPNDTLEYFNGITTAVHEIVHALSDNGDNKMGFMQRGENTIGRTFSEMATCYTTVKILGKGSGGGYSEDHDEIFKMFLKTMKMDDEELYKIFFGPDNWLTEEIKTRFNKNELNALNDLVSLYDKRTTKEFDFEKALEIMLRSAETNQIENDEEFLSSVKAYCDYADIPIPNREKVTMQELVTFALGPAQTSSHDVSKVDSIENSIEIVYEEDEKDEW